MVQYNYKTFNTQHSTLFVGWPKLDRALKKEKELKKFVYTNYSIYFCICKWWRR